MVGMIRQACILVGGKGTRLGDLTRGTPKPLLGMGDDVTFLDLLIEQISRQGFDDVVLLAGYLGERVQNRYAGRTIGNSCVRVLVEPQPLGTGGALGLAAKVLAPRFLLLNGDSFFDINLRGLVADAAGYEAAIALRQVDDPSRYGTAELDGTLIRRFREKDPAISGSALINGGIYVLGKTLLDYLTKVPCSIESEIFPILAAEGKLAGFVREGYFLDIGLPATLEQGRRELRKRNSRPTAFLDEAILDKDSLAGADQADWGWDRQRWIEGAPESIRHLNELGFGVVVISKQSTGSASERDRMQAALADFGAFIDRFAPVSEEPACAMERSFMIGPPTGGDEAARTVSIPTFRFSGGNLFDFVKKCVVETDRTG